MEHIDGYGTDPSRETGNDVKDAFLKDASQYLKAVSTVLLDQGFTVGTDGKGRPMKAVSVNEAGPAGSGDVSLRLDHPDTGARLYATVGASSLRGTVPTTASGIAIMFRDEKRGLSGSQNRWAPVGLSAGELAAMMAKEAGVASAPLKSPVRQSRPQMQLQNWKAMAKAHWKEHLPVRFKSLRRPGRSTACWSRRRTRPIWKSASWKRRACRRTKRGRWCGRSIFS